jgi:hypothetical protein
MDTAKAVLGAKGSKLHPEEIHLRRTKNGYIAKHLLRDKDGKSPSDGQRDTAEYNLADPKEIAAHMAEHAANMQPQEPNEPMTPDPGA